MRDQIIEYLKGENLQGLALTDDLPFVDGGVELYLQRPKTIYLDATQNTFEAIFQTLGGESISNEVLTTSIFFTVDAKKVLPSYQKIVQTIKNAKDKVKLDGVNLRDASVSTDYNNSALVTQVDIILTRLANQ